MKTTETQRNFRKQMKQHAKHNDSWAKSPYNRHNWSGRPSRINKDTLRSYLILAGIILGVYFFWNGY